MLRIPALALCTAAAILINVLLPLHAVGQDGTLDPTFNDDGRVITVLGEFDDAATGIAMQRDRIVVVGQTYQDGRYAIFVARYLLNGALDDTFGSDGVTTTFIGTGDARARAVAIQNDGAIVVAGLSVIDSREVLTVARYNGKTGTLDNTFSDDGIVQTPVGAGWSAAHAVALDADGKILVAGYSQSGPDYVMAVVRYDDRGELDATFGANGVVTTQYSIGNDVAYGIGVFGPDEIYVAGSSHRTGSNSDVAIAMYKSSGELHGAFGTEGKVRHASVGAFNEYGFGLAIQRDGKPIIVGHTNSTFHDVLVTRYTRGGALDFEFGNNGIVTTDFGTGVDDGQGTAAVVQPDDKILVAGLASLSAEPEFALVRYLSSGSIDSTFGDAGLVFTGFGSNSADQGRAMTLQPDGKILVVGQSHNGTQGRIAIARYNNPSIAAASSVRVTQPATPTIIPHPFNTSTTLVFEQDLVEPTVVLYDALGERMSCSVQHTANRLDIAAVGLAAGMYVVHIVEASGRRVVQTVLVQR